MSEEQVAEISPEKARKILNDGTVHGKKLTAKQKRFMAAKGKIMEKKAKKLTLNDIPREALRKAKP